MYSLNWKHYTVLGGRDLPGLPKAELFKIKKAIIYHLFASYWNNSEDF